MDPHAALWEDCLQPAGLSDIGLRRPNNQDSLAILLASSQEKWEQRGHLFLVADGMGAHAAGELASKLATDVIPLTYHKLLDRPPEQALLAAIQDANLQIHTRGAANDDFRGMGTTISALVLGPFGALVAHVGDSRVYRLRGTRLDQLTFDHSLAWELRAARHIPQDTTALFIPKNIITRSLGPNPHVQIDLEGPLPICPGDTYLLCSDGLSGQLHDDEIGKVLLALPPHEAVQALIDLANLRGGPDNITVIVVRVTGPQVAKHQTAASASAQHPPRRPPVPPAVWSAMGVLALGAAVAAAFGERIAAVVGLAGAAVAGGMAVVYRFRSRGVRWGKQPPLGHGPYATCLCTPDASFPARLAEMTQQLRDAAASANWEIDWDRFCDHESRAVGLVRQADYLQATAEFCRAISSMMDQLRHQAQRGQTGR